MHKIYIYIYVCVCVCVYFMYYYYLHEMPFWRNYISCKLQTKFGLNLIENQHYITTVHHSLHGSFRDVRFTLRDKDSIITLYILYKKHIMRVPHKYIYVYELHTKCSMLMHSTNEDRGTLWFFLCHKQVITQTCHRSYSEPDKLFTTFTH